MNRIPLALALFAAGTALLAPACTALNPLCTGTRCGDACVDLQADARHCGACGAACGAGMLCSGGVCDVACAAGLTACGNSCADTTRNAANCGSCGNACMPGSVCVASRCAIACPAGQTACSGACVNLLSDGSHCGACGKACDRGSVCSVGACAVACPAGQSVCNGGCVNLLSDVNYCGSCNHRCGPGSLCVNGACIVSCPLGQADCNGSCANLATDRGHCGGCGQACGPGLFCVMGRCAASCALPLLACDDSCVDPRSDPQHCGGCGAACMAPPNATAVCLAARCRLGPCAGGYVNCDGQEGNGCEVSVFNNVRNCGGCGVICSANHIAAPSCGNGACNGTCDASFGDCDNDKASNGCESDLINDAKNCGACGVVCANGLGCSGGKCVPVYFLASKLVSAPQGELINGWVGAPNQRWKLCYQRSRDGASALVFHNACDGLGPSVVVTSLNTGVLIGGYASNGWNSNNAYYGDDKSFLFSLSNKFRHVMTNSSYPLYGTQKYGPTFGGGHDWHVDTNITGGYCNLGYNYACRVGAYGSNECRSDFCGSYSGWGVTEMEVWVR